MRKLLLILTTIVSLMMNADPLAIRSGGNRVLGRLDSPSTMCHYTYYSPFVLIDRDPVIEGRREVLYTMGGWIYSPLSQNFMSPDRIADKVWYSHKVNGKWTEPELMLSRSNFSWMQDEAYITAHPESYIGALSTGAVVKVDGRYFMAFAGTVNDPNLCCGEHSGGNPYGSCATPWSYFVAFWATSTDGRHWTVVENPFGSTSADLALRASFLRTVPTKPEETMDTAGGGYKGVVGISLVFHQDDAGQKWFYFTYNLWTAQWGPKTGMGRIRYDASSATGFTGTPEIWDTATRTWQTTYNGVMPAWISAEQWRGQLHYLPVGKISPTTKVPGYRYLMPLAGVSWKPRTPGVDRGIYNEIGYALSNDLVNWTPYQKVDSRIPYFADGTAYDASVLDPSYTEELDGSYSFYFGSAVTREGYHLCDPGPPTPDNPTSTYFGLGIYQGSSIEPHRRRAVAH